MGREIKFRAWDGNQMSDPFDINDVAYGYDEGYFCNNSNVDFDILKKEIKIMQYTGLKDKNGKEIWEGDIVKEIYQDFKDDEAEKLTDFERIGAIEWREKGFWVDIEDFGWEGESLWNWENFEIIGNIYQDKYLLKA